MSRHLCKRDLILSLFFIVLGLRCHCPLRAAALQAYHFSASHFQRDDPALRIAGQHRHLPSFPPNSMSDENHVCIPAPPSLWSFKPGQGVQVGCRVSDFRRVTLMYVYLAGQTGSELGIFLHRVWSSVKTAHFALRGTSNPRFSAKMAAELQTFADWFLCRYSLFD